jgi:hypothetical protein
LVERYHYTRIREGRSDGEKNPGYIIKRKIEKRARKAVEKLRARDLVKGRN